MTRFWYEDVAYCDVCEVNYRDVDFDGVGDSIVITIGCNCRKVKRKIRSNETTKQAWERTVRAWNKKDWDER